MPGEKEQGIARLFNLLLRQMVTPNNYQPKGNKEEDRVAGIEVSFEKFVLPPLARCE